MKSQDSEDDSPPLFFLLAILACIVVPWGSSVLWTLLKPGRREIAKMFPKMTEDGLRVRHCQTRDMTSRREAQIAKLRSHRRLLTRGFLFRLVILVFLSCWLAYIVMQVRRVLATSQRYQNFDPYDILEVSRSSKLSEIKKAFRRMALKYHPDQNPDPAAAERFLIIKKAHDALTDPIAKRNYAQYGNPDGPTKMEISVALPSFGKEVQGLVLVVFVIFFVVGVPLMMLWCMGSNEEGNGALHEAMVGIAKGMKASMDARSALDLLLRSGEGMLCKEREEDRAALATIWQELPVGGGGSGGGCKKTSRANSPATKAEVLFHVHAHRRRDLLSGSLAADLDKFLILCRVIALGMVDLGMKQGSADMVLAALDLHRCLVQALEPETLISGGAGLLLQVPYFSTDRLKLWKKGPCKATTISAFTDHQERRRAGLSDLDLDSQQEADIEAFASVAPRLTLRKAEVFVEGEDSICVGDFATLQVTLRRENLQDDEAVGAAHTPHFPSMEVPEAWWLLLSLPGKSARTLCARVDSPGRDFVARLQFQTSLVGKCRCTLRLLCEAYAGFDIEEQVVFEVKQIADKDDDSGDEEGEDEEDDDE